MASFGATFSAPNLASLLEALVDAAPYARGLPRRMRHGFKVVAAVPDWRQRLIEDENGVSVDWGDDTRIAHNPEAVAADFPDVALDARAVLDFVAPLPFELAVLPIVEDYWPENDYYAPAIGADHALLGWGMIFKGAGHERSVVSRRWLEHGPFRTLRGPHDTTLVQFHDLAADGPTSLAQAQPAHEWMVAGFLRPKHRYKHDIAGVYTAEDRLLRVVVNDREVSDRELLDACAARRDGRADPAKPIDNVAYVFVDPAAAQAKLEALWLRGLECRVVEPRGERRLDVDYQPRLANARVGERTAMTEFPEGAAIAAERWTITETLRGGPDRGMFRATGAGRALVTMGPPQREDHDALRMRFALAVPGVAPLLAITTVVGEGVPYDVLVEAEPEGAPVTERRPDDPQAIARGLAATVARAHAAGYVLGGIRPELVYAARDGFTGIAPRAEPFLALAPERSYGVPPCFDEVYASPEALSLLPTTAASDVFSLCATLVFLLDGTPPFAGANLLERMAAALRGMHRPTAVHPTIVAGLSPSPATRPDAAAVLGALAS